MTTCARNSLHEYPPHNKHCPWCAVEKATAAATATATAKIKAVSQVHLPAPRPPSTGTPRVVQSNQTAKSPAVIPVPRVAPPPNPASAATWLHDYRPFNRVGAGLLTMVAMFGCIFSAQVLTRIWSYTYSPAMLQSFVNGIIELQKNYFLLILASAMFVAVLGSRAKWLPFGVQVLAVILTVFHGSVPPLPIVPIPSFVVGVLQNLQGSWGEGTVLVTMIVFPLAIITMVSVATKLLPAPSQRVLNARASRKQAIKRFLGTPSNRDRRTLSIAMTSILTIVPSWLVGRFILQDNFLLERNSGVYNTAAREFWPYVPAQFLAGASCVLMLASLVWLFQRWAPRRGMVLVALAAVAVYVFVGLPVAASLWNAEETRTVERLANTAFPFSDSYQTCGNSSLMLIDRSKMKALWQVHTASAKGSAGNECNRLIIYKGWKEMGKFDLPKGQEISSSPVPNKGKNTDKAKFTVTSDKGKKFTVSIKKYDK